MPVRPIVQYPDPVVKRVAEQVGPITDLIGRLFADLVETMRAAPATVGLAAPQIGVPSRCFVMDCTGHAKVPSPSGLIALVDPDVVEDGPPELGREGCLSVPDLTANVFRSSRVEVRGQDVEGERRVYRLEGFEARVALHEIDHLDGTLILDRVSSASDLFARKVYR